MADTRQYSRDDLQAVADMFGFSVVELGQSHITDENLAGLVDTVNTGEELYIHGLNPEQATELDLVDIFWTETEAGERVGRFVEAAADIQDEAATMFSFMREHAVMIGLGIGAVGLVALVLR